MKKAIFLVMVALVLSTGCSSPERELKPFVGRPSSELIGVWGSPQEKAPDGRGGEIWTYVKMHSYTMADYTQTQTRIEGGRAITSTTYTPARSYHTTAARIFYVNPEGVVYKYSWHGR